MLSISSFLSSVSQSCPTLCNPMNRSTPVLPVYYQLPESTQIHVTILSSIIPFSSCPQSFPALESFQMSQLFTSSGQSIGVSASALVFSFSFFFKNFYFYFILLYNTVLVLPYIDMNQPQAYMSSQS